MAKKETLDINSLVVQNPDLKPSLIQFEAFKVQLEQQAKMLDTIEIKDDSTLSILEQNLSKMNDLVKSVEENSKQLKQPYLDKGRAIDAAAEYVTSVPQNSIKLAKDKKLKWVMAVEAEKTRKTELQARIDKLTNWWLVSVASADSIEALSKMEKQLDTVKGVEYYQERNKEVQELKKKYLEVIALMKMNFTNEESTPDVQEAIKEAIEEAKEEISEVISESVVTEPITKIKGIRERWKWDVADITKVPKEWLCVDESKVREFLSNNKETLTEQVLNGIKFYKEKSITA